MNFLKNAIALANLIDEIESGKFSEDQVVALFSASKSALNSISPRIWKLAAELEVGRFISTNLAQSHKELIQKKSVPDALSRLYFSKLAETRLLPHFTPKPNEFKSGGHTLFLTSKLLARQTLELACALKTPSDVDLYKAARVAISSNSPENKDLGLYLGSLLKIGFNPGMRNHAFMENLDVALGGQDILFREDVSESDVLEKVTERCYPLFRELNKFDTVEFVTPLTMKYHLITTNKTPMEKLMNCKESERESLLILMRA